MELQKKTNVQPTTWVALNSEWLNQSLSMEYENYSLEEFAPNISDDNHSPRQNAAWRLVNHIIYLLHCFSYLKYRCRESAHSQPQEQITTIDRSPYKQITYNHRMHSSINKTPYRNVPKSEKHAAAKFKRSLDSIITPWNCTPLLTPRHGVLAPLKSKRKRIGIFIVTAITKIITNDREHQVIGWSCAHARTGNPNTHLPIWLLIAFLLWPNEQRPFTLSPIRRD